MQAGVEVINIVIVRACATPKGSFEPVFFSHGLDIELRFLSFVHDNNSPWIEASEHPTDALSLENTVSVREGRVIVGKDVNDWTCKASKIQRILDLPVHIIGPMDALHTSTVSELLYRH